MQPTALPMGSFNYCPVPFKNPGLFHPEAGKAYVGQWAEYVMGSYNKPKTKIWFKDAQGNNLRYYLPDNTTGLNGDEYKNVAKLSLTRQLRETRAAINAQGGVYTLYVRRNTYLSGPLQAAIDGKTFKLDYLPDTL
ncbi:putative toxin [Paenarthrobacter sp. AMU7]|uniref:Toxin n=1 Tax=Paenarthrobacter sp. AMU7 TaxID=3162492 RepID=A0AB39YML2_9MICC